MRQEEPTDSEEARMQLDGAQEGAPNHKFEEEVGMQQADILQRRLTEG